MKLEAGTSVLDARALDAQNLDTKVGGVCITRMEIWLDNAVRRSGRLVANGLHQDAWRDESA